MSELLGIARFKFHEGQREAYLRFSDDRVIPVNRGWFSLAKRTVEKRSAVAPQALAHRMPP